MADSGFLILCASSSKAATFRVFRNKREALLLRFHDLVVSEVNARGAIERVEFAPLVLAEKPRFR